MLRTTLTKEAVHQLKGYLQKPISDELKTRLESTIHSAECKLKRRIAMRFILVGLFLTLMLIGTATYALAHSWYPYECCHERDCNEVESYEYIKDPNNPLALPGLSVTITLPWHNPSTGKDEPRKHTAVVPSNLIRRDSPDNKMHACMIGGRVICIFVPPGN